MEILSYIVEEGLIMIPALYILGWMIKNTNKLENWLIPFILLGVSLILTPLIIDGYSPDNVVQAILITGVTVLGDQMVKQARKGD